MTIALITDSRESIVSTYDDGTTSFTLPGGDVIEGATVGWSGEGYSLVSVVPFAAPAGRQIVGAPSYSFDGEGNVIETYATQAAPAPSISALAFRQLFTSAERLAITTAAQSSAPLREFMDDESAAGEVSLSDPEVSAGIAALVAAGVLTQDRATAILAGSPPPS
jgi:hypothetical protein